MTQKIGLEAVFDDKAFHSGVDRYNRAIDAMVGKTTSGAGSMGSQFAGLGTKVLSLAGLLGTALVAGAGAAGIAMASFVADGVTQAIEFEAALDGIQAVLGATGEEIAALGDLIIDLGLDPRLKVTAEEAAAAIDMLARNGLSATEILEGAAEATVLLANATGADFSVAANVATDAMAIFNIEAADMIEAVNGITSVTTGSKFDVNDYALALAQAGGVAASAGVEFNDFNTSVAAISPLFASGSDAGTSFKTMLTRLVPTTDKAEGLMYDLGIITEETGNRFFDAEGNLKSMNDIAVILNETFAGMTEEQRNAAMATLFGADSMRAATGLMDAGAVAYTDAATAAEELGVSIDEANQFIDGGITKYEALMLQMQQTDAVDAAATRMDNLKGAMEILGGVVDAVKLQIGNAFLPTIRQVVDAVTSFLSENQDAIIGFFTNIANGISEFVTSISEGQTPIQAFFDALAAAGIDEGTITSIQNIVTEIQNFIDKIVSFVSEHAEAFKGAIIGIGAVLGASVIVAIISGIVAAISALATPVTAIIAAAALLGAAWSENWFGIRDTVTQAWTDLQPTFQTIKDWLETNIPIAIEAVTTAFNNISDWFTENKQTILGFIDSVITPVKEAWEETATAMGDMAGDQFAKVGDWFKENQPLIQDFAKVLGTVLVVAAAALAKAISFVYVQLARFTRIVALPFLDGLVTHFLNVATLIMQIVTGDWAGAWESVKTIVSDSVANLISLLGGLVDWIAGWFGSSLEEIGTVWSGIWDNLTAIVSLVWQNITTAISTAWAGIVAWFTGVVTSFTDGWNAFWDGLSLTVATIWNAIVTFITDSINTFVGNWNAFWEGLKLTVDTIWEAIKTFVIDTITSLFEGMGLSLDEMKERWSTIWSDVLLIIQTVWDLITTWVSEKINAVKATIEAVVSAVQAWWGATWDAISTKVSEIWTAIVTAVSDRVNAIKTDIETVVGNVKTWWETTWDAISTKVSEIWTAIVTAVSDKVNEVKTDVEETTGEVKTWWETTWDEIKTKVTDIWTEIVTAVTEKLEEVRTAVEEKINEVKTWIGERVADFKQVGSDIITGLKDGILENAGAVLEAITGIVEDAIAWAKSLLGIASPSKVFEEIGVDAIAGMIRGILDSKGELSDAMGAAIEPIIAFGQKLGSFGSTVASQFKESVLGPMEQDIKTIEDRLTGQNENLEKFQDQWAKSLGMTHDEFMANLPRLILEANMSGDKEFLGRLQHMAMLTSAIDGTQASLNEATATYAKEQERILQLEKQRQDLAFLQQQLNLLDMIRDAGLDPSEILGGVELGLDADLPALIDAMSNAMSAIVNAANQELQIASPSKVFARIGKQILSGLVSGLDKVSPVVSAMERVSMAVVDTAMESAKTLANQAGQLPTFADTVNATRRMIPPLSSSRPFVPAPVVNVDAAAPSYNATFNTRQNDVSLSRAFRLLELSHAS